MDWNQLEGLRRRVDEEFSLDMAAIERLQKRFRLTGGDTPDSLKDQLEQDYGLDIAAIERLQRRARMIGEEASAKDYPAARDYAPESAPAASTVSSETRASAPAKYEAVPQPPDQLENSLRTMFNQFSGNSKR